MSAGCRIAVGVSGVGRSLANLLKVQRPGAGLQVAAVIASRADCDAAALAAAAKLPLFIGDFSPRALAATGDRLYAWLEEHAVDWIALAGFIKLFPLQPRWHNRVVNIHPALLPRHGGPGMYGDRVHAAVLAAGDAQSGASVHYVNERYDEGALIAQISVPVLPGDHLRSLADRIFAAECQLYPLALDRLLSGALPLPDGAVERHSYVP